MKKIIIFVLVLSSFFAQDSFGTNHTTTVFSTVCDSTTNVNILAGTIVSVTLNEEIYIDEMQIGNAIDFFVRSNVVMAGKVVIQSGAIAEGWIKKVETSCDGSCKKITITVENVQAVDGQRIYLRSIPHVVKINCCGKKGKKAAIVPLGTNLSARFLNNETIKVKCPQA